jgi:hypothetical protein
MQTYRMYQINSQLEVLCKRIDELHQGLELCSDPFLYGNLLGSVSILIDRQSQLSLELNKLKQEYLIQDKDYQQFHKDNIK